MFNEAPIWLLTPLMCAPLLLAFWALWCLSKVGPYHSQGLSADPVWLRRFVIATCEAFVASGMLLAIIAYKMSPIASPFATTIGFIAAAVGIVLSVGLLFYIVIVAPYQLRALRRHA